MKQKQSAWIRMHYNTQDYLKHTMAIMMVPLFRLLLCTPNTYIYVGVSSHKHVLANDTRV